MTRIFMHALPPMYALRRKFDIVERGVGSIMRAFEKQIKAGRMTQEEATRYIGRIETAVSLEVG